MADAVRARFDFAGRRLAPGAPDRVIAARRIEEVVPALEAVQQATKRGALAAGFVAYEAASAFDAALVTRAPLPALPLVWFGVWPHGTAELAPAAGVGSAAAAASSRSGAGEALDLAPDVGAAAHAAAVARIRAAIRAGDVYQVNHTLRMTGRAEGDLDELAARLGRAQARGYFADLEVDGQRIISLSPELFFAVRGRTITTRPMKGTARRGRWPTEDDAAAARLAASEKERAENLMIVDLMRNDLGRVARFGSVRVPRLFEIERYPTVHQMTSTITAALHERAGLVDIFRALFPCGSVTGAPKIAAMRFIAELETSPRGVYCGAIGIVEPGGDCTFSVAIRTLHVDVATRSASYGIGGGITWDSNAAGEYDEALAKAAVLRRRRTDFDLLETLRVEDGELVRGDAHLARVAESAAYFGRPFDAAAAARALAAFAARRDGRWKVRLLVAGDGSVRVEGTRLSGVAGEAQPPLTVRLVPDAVRSDDAFLFHKTTARAPYERALERAAGCDEALLVNEHGELTELVTGNLIVELPAGLATPARTSGLLAGVFRDALLRDGRVAERVLRQADLEAALRCWLVNSVREWVPIATIADERGVLRFDGRSRVAAGG
jgi:para-aminobenzoate synthetase / 4-amino-4-deoxychorismate lyase